MRSIVASVLTTAVGWVLAVGCGGGGGGAPTPPPSDFSGEWYTRETRDLAGCGGGPVVEPPIVVTVVQAGANLTATTPYGVLSGSIEGDRATLAGVLFDGASYTTIGSLALTRVTSGARGPAQWTSSPNATGFPVTCSGTSSFDLVRNLRLVSFNLPDVAGVELNTPLVFRFNDDVDPMSITPDTVRIVGTPSFTFESIVVDGDSIALLPFVPNFEDYSDSGMAPGTTYDVFLPSFPSVDLVRSVWGAPLAAPESFLFATTPAASFVEPRRPLVHAPGPFSGPDGRGDEDGCLQNPTNEHYEFPGFQLGSDATARLLCLVNEGAPRVRVGACAPTHDQRSVGTPSATVLGSFDLGAIRIRLDEPLDPVSVVPWDPTTQLSVNVQLWRVGDASANPIDPPVQVRTNKPIVSQSVQVGTEVILAPVGPEPPGTYVVNVSGVTDLPGNALLLSDSPDPAVGGYAGIDAGLAGTVPAGVRLYFRTP